MCSEGCHCHTVDEAPGTATAPAGAGVRAAPRIAVAPRAGLATGASAALRRPTLRADIFGLSSCTSGGDFVATAPRFPLIPRGIRGQPDVLRLYLRLPGLIQARC